MVFKERAKEGLRRLPVVGLKPSRTLLPRISNTGISALAASKPAALAAVLIELLIVDIKSVRETY